MTPDRLYRFIQFEYPWPLGPVDGRYLIRDHAGEEAHHVLVFASWATTTQRRSRRWTREPEPQRVPAETGLSRATLVETTVVDPATAQAWLAEIEGPAAGEAVSDGLLLVNSAIRGHRAAAADPTVREVTAEQALTVRAGYGAGDEVAEGDWTQARDLPSPGSQEGNRRQRREAALRPQERLAALLSGRDAVLACEELALRARLDLDQRRPREAALQTHIALEAAVAELQAYRGSENLSRRLGELEALRVPMSAAANEALQGGPSDATTATVSDALEQIEATLRARAAVAAY